MAETFFRTYTRDDDTEVTVEIAVNSWGCAAQTYGPAESCFDAEPMEVEITDAWIETGAEDAPKVTLTDAERQRFEQAFCEDPPEADDYDPCDERI